MNPDHEPDNDEAHLPVPAGAARVALGIAALLSGAFVAAISRSEWVRAAGLMIFLLSPPIMLKWPEKEFK
jgi:hypothetical protein